jgi:superfamily I DNA/RNA helicase
MPDILKDLNSAQKEAVEQIDGPCMIVAGAGSGKSMLSAKIAFQ